MRLAILIGLGNAIGQHDLRRDLFQSVAGGLHKAVGVRSVDNHGDAWIGAELTGTHGQGRGPAFAERWRAGLHGFRQQEHRVDRAKLAEERNRFRALGAKIEQSAATAKRAGKADGIDQRMRDQRFADLAVATPIGRRLIIKDCQRRDRGQL